MLSGEDPAHPVLSAVGFGGAVASVAWLLPVGHPVQPDPLMLVIVGVTAAAAGVLLLVAGHWRAVAAISSTLVLVCVVAIRSRANQGTWSGLPLPLVPVAALTMLSWVPRSRRGWVPRSRRGRLPPGGGGDPTRLAGPPHDSWGAPGPAGGTTTVGVWPAGVSEVVRGRWAVLGGQPLPDADVAGHSRVHPALDLWCPGRLVVVKLPKPEHGQQGRMRLAREAELLRACGGSPRVVRLIDSGPDHRRGTFAVVLAHHPDGSLARLLATTSGFRLGWALAITSSALRGLVDLQERCGPPIVHRDVNPRNLLLDGSPNGRPAVVICDLGMALRVPGNPGNDDAVTLGLVYSPWYGAPELLREPSARGLEIDAYGMGAVLYELVTGQPPLRRESVRLGGDFATLVRGGVAPVSAGAGNPDLPNGLVDLLDRCLAARPGDRPPAARCMLRELELVTRGFENLPIPFGRLRRSEQPTGRRSA
jgi:serine/threonine protein kinase